MTALHASILLPFLFALVVPFLYRLVRFIHTGWFVLAVPLTLFIFYTRYIPIPVSETHIYTVSWIQTLGIEFSIYLDSLSLLFSLIISGIGSLVVLYSIFYMSKEREALHNFYVYLLCFMGAMLGVVLSDHLLVLYTFWEITSFSSFLLIAYWFERKKSRHGAMKSLLITVTGGFAMLFGIFLLRAATGTFSIREIIASGIPLSEHALFIPAMICILLGAFTKSAQFPFHIWLPDAMEAPTPISAYLHSATMVKAGVYLVARLTPVFGGNSVWTWSIIAVGLITLFWASFMAIRQIDLKAMMAFSTVSQLGLIMTLLGIGSIALKPGLSIDESMLFSAAVLAAVFHLLNHSVFKGCLFMVVGILDHELGTRDIRKLSGLLRYMPISFTLTLIGTFSMAGLPPFSGFLSKEMFFTGVLNAFQGMGGWTVLIPVVAWIASIFTFIYCMILLFKTFTGKPDVSQLDKPPHEAPFGMLIPPIVLGVLAFVFFLVPNVLSVAILEPSMHAILPGLLDAGQTFPAQIQAWHGWNAELWMTIGVVLLGIVLYRNLPKWRRIYEFLPSKWTLDRLFDESLAGMERISVKVTRSYMTGFTGHYLAYLFGFVIIFVGGTMILLHAVKFDFSGNSPIHWYEYVLGLALVAASVYLLFSRQRLLSIITLSAVGFLVALLFVNFRAPDLALTQFAVETISTCLFLLCFYFLPKMSKEDPPSSFRVPRLIISIGVGTVLTLIGLASVGHKVFEPIAHFFDNAYELAGARNIVNAILVDFRGFDTMLEILVLFMAGLGVYTLIKFRRSGKMTIGDGRKDQ